MSGSLKSGGRQLVLNGRTFTLLPLTLGAVEDFEERLEKLESLPMLEKLRVILDLAHRALQRAHPDLTRDEVRELIDMDNAPVIYSLIMGASIPKADEPGEAGAMANGTGLPSMPTSAPVSGGPSTTAVRKSRSTTSKH